MPFPADNQVTDWRPQEKWLALMELRILIADDNPEYRFLLRRFIERGTTFEVVGEAADGEEAIRLVDELKPQAVVMDVMMPVLDGVDATREIKDRHPGIRVIALTHSTDHSHAVDMMAAGVDGYFLKSEPVDKLLYQLDSIAQVARSQPLY
jgi:DNA-binding NarL/FixJ family response regulator